MSAYITDVTKLKRAISSIAKRGKRLDGDIHLVALSAAVHARDHNDGIYISRLMDAMPKSTRAKGLKLWFEAYFPVTINDSDTSSHVTKLKKGRTADDYQVDIADAVPFWDYSKEQAAPVTQKVESIRSYLEKLASGGSERKPASPEAREMSRELIAVLDRAVALKTAENA